MSSNFVLQISEGSTVWSRSLLPACPAPLTLMSIHILLTFIIIISFHSADLVNTSILNVSMQPRGNQGLRPRAGVAAFTLISGSYIWYVWTETDDLGRFQGL